MKAIGFVRRMDNLGRIVLPMGLRRMFNIQENDGLEIFVEDDCIILSKYKPACLFCGSNDDISQYKGKNICSSCLATLSQRPE